MASRSWNCGACKVFVCTCVCVCMSVHACTCACMLVYVQGRACCKDGGEPGLGEQQKELEWRQEAL